MARLGVQAYRDIYLKEVETRLNKMSDSIPNFTPRNLHMAIMSEMNRADDETGVEVPDDRGRAIREAKQRAIEFIRTRKDLSRTKTL